MRLPIVLVAGLLAGAGCADPELEASHVTGGDPDRGAALISEVGCRSCHTIPGIPGANARIGPPLDGVALRTYIAGVLTNSPDHMIRWLMDPPAVDSLTAMPNLGLTEVQARHIASYLYTLD